MKKRKNDSLEKDLVDLVKKSTFSTNGGVLLQRHSHHPANESAKESRNFYEKIIRGEKSIMDHWY